MRIVVFGPDQRVGVIDGQNIVDANLAYAKYARETQDEPLPYALAAAMAPANLQEFIEAGARAIEMTQKAVEYLGSKASDKLGVRGETVAHPAESVRLKAPFPAAARMMMCANNFADHAYGIRTNRGKETGITVESVYNQNRERGARAFWKIAGNVVGTEDDIIYPDRTKLFDYEGEIAIVLGRSGSDIPLGRVNDFAWGYTILNDWSMRDRQPDGLGELTLSLAKNFNTSASLGPSIVVGEPFDPQNIPFETKVNGMLRQQGNTKGMVFSFDEYLNYLSRDLMLRPGDIISAGTSSGTAMDSSTYDDKGAPVDNKYLRPGDVVEVSSPAVGTLRNRIVAKA